MSSEWPIEATVQVTFTERAGKTRLTLQHFPRCAGREREMCDRLESPSRDSPITAERAARLPAWR